MIVFFLSIHRLVVGQSLKLRRVVPVLGVPDALVPLTQLSLLPGYYPLANLISYFCLNSLKTDIISDVPYCRETSVIWVSIDVPNGQPPGQYEGEITVSAMKTDGG